MPHAQQVFSPMHLGRRAWPSMQHGAWQGQGSTCVHTDRHMHFMRHASSPRSYIIAMHARNRSKDYWANEEQRGTMSDIRRQTEETIGNSIRTICAHLRFYAPTLLPYAFSNSVRYGRNCVHNSFVITKFVGHTECTHTQTCT